MALVGPMGSMAGGVQAGIQDQKGMLDFLQRKMTADRVFKQQQIVNDREQRKEFDADVEKAEEASQTMNPSNQGNFFDYLDRSAQKWGDAWPQRLTPRYFQPTPSIASPSAGGGTPPPGLTMAGGSGGGMFKPAGGGLPSGPQRVGSPAVAPGVNQLPPLRNQGFGSPKAQSEYYENQSKAAETGDPGMMQNLNEYMMEMGGGGLAGMVNLMKDQEAFTVAVQVWRAQQMRQGKSPEYINKALSQFIQQQKDTLAWVKEGADDGLSEKKLREQYRKALESSMVLFFGKKLGVGSMGEILEMLDPKKKAFALRMLQEGLQKLIDGKEYLEVENELLEQFKNIPEIGKNDQEREPLLPVDARRDIEYTGMSDDRDPELMKAPVHQMFGPGSKVTYSPNLGMHVVLVPQQDGKVKFEVLTRDMLDAFMEQPGPSRSPTAKFNEALKRSRQRFPMDQPAGSIR